MRFVFALLAGGLMFGGGGVAAAEGETNDTMMILDASGSMWGVVGGETKIAAARSAVRTLLDGWPATRRLGLMAYGHRRKGDCADIETIAPVGTADAAAIGAAVDRLNPKGKTPIADALTRAATDLRSSETRATILLVSDGIETCGGDPCAVARALDASGVDFTAHVVGFDVTDPAARAQLQCIADVSGGVYRDAADAGGLAEALKQVAGEAGGTAKTAPAEEEDTTQNLRGTVRLSPESDPLVAYTTAVGWTVTTPDGATSLGGDVGAVLSESVEPQPVKVRVEYGNASAETTATVEAGRITRVDLSLDAGRIVSEATQAGIPGTASQNWGQLTWKILQAADRAEVTYSFEPVPTFVLPAGSYILTVMKDEFAKGEKPFEVKAGDELNVGLVLVAGTLHYNVPGAYFLQVLDPKTEEALGSFDGGEGEKALNPGDYILKVVYRDAADVLKPFTIREGETTEVAVSP
ncbi:MAG: VWA domain-containing protein [Alphaproteobacteria bacterium]|nr:VWA domain-containing protein [Alphaproteobacteria bacterium]